MEHEETINAYLHIEPHLWSIPESQLAELGSSAQQASDLGLEIAHFAKQDRQQIIELYRKPPLEEIDSLEERALALRGAERASPLMQSQECESPESLSDRGQHLRHRHLTILKAIFFGDESVEEQMGSISTDRSPLLLGRALLDLVALEREHWELVETTGLIATSEFEELGHLGRQLNSTQPRGAAFNSQRDPCEGIQRAWTYFVMAARLVRDHTYLIYRCDIGEWQRRYPDLC